jgi:hypothetical protein
MLIIYEHLIGHSPLIVDKTVPVLRNEVIYFRVLSQLGVSSTGNFLSVNFKVFFAIEFFALKTLPQNFAKKKHSAEKKIIRYPNELEIKDTTECSTPASY